MHSEKNGNWIHVWSQKWRSGQAQLSKVLGRKIWWLLQTLHSALKSHLYLHCILVRYQELLPDQSKCSYYLGLGGHEARHWCLITRPSRIFAMLSKLFLGKSSQNWMQFDTKGKKRMYALCEFGCVCVCVAPICVFVVCVFYCSCPCALWELECMCVCVCVCVRERDRESECVFIQG